jgi:hypothetical protein
MLHLLPGDASRVGSILGIDPGTQSLGTGIIDIDVTTLEIVRSTATTFVGDKLGPNRWLANVHSDRFARLDAHRRNLLELLHLVQPISVVCESPFFNSRRPQAFSALVETVDMVRHAVWEYDQNMVLDLIDPPSVKRAVNAAGNAGKDDVHLAISKISEFKYSGLIPFASLDEHSIDALAVAYSKLIEYRKGP